MFEVAAIVLAILWVPFGIWMYNAGSDATLDYLEREGIITFEEE
jgi:hypothetical protein